MRPASCLNNKPDTVPSHSTRYAALLCLAWATASSVMATAAEPRFRDLSKQLPLQHVYDGDWEFYVGGGLAVFDCNDDAMPDVFAAGGSNPSVLLRNSTTAPGAELTFELIASDALSMREVIGAYPIDIDGDTRLDLFVLRVGANRVMKGLGNCRFEDATDTWSIDPGDGWSTAFSATWEAGNDWPTLAVGNYVDRKDPKGPFGTCDAHQLFRPVGQHYAPADIITPGYCSLSMLFTDWSGTGQQHLWISNDRHYYVHDGHEQLFRIRPEIHEFTEDEGWRQVKLWGMGIASRDLSGDGLPEIAVTSMADQKLFTLEKHNNEPRFKASAYERNMTAHIPHIGYEGRPSTGWHVQFGDVDNDGRDDVFIAKGNVNQMPSSAMADPDNLMVQLADGTFEEKAADAGVASTERGRGAAFVDFNRDGKLDLMVVQRRAPLALYQNTTQTDHHWVSLDVQQALGNRFAIGARIELDTGERRILREIQSGGGHAGGQRLPEHVGLGALSDPDSHIRVRIHWPDGEVSTWLDIETDKHSRIERQPDGTTLEFICEPVCT